MCALGGATDSSSDNGMSAVAGSAFVMSLSDSGIIFHGIPFKLSKRSSSNLWDSGTDRNEDAWNTP